MERAADEALTVLSEAPPLMLLVVVAALFELTLARVLWHGFSDVIDVETLRRLRDLARFPRNLAAVGGTAGLVFALLSFLRHPGFAPIGRRLAIAAFSGIFVPSVVVAALLPAASLRPRLVIFGLAAANVLVTLLAMTAVRYRPPRAVRVAMGLVAATAFLSLTVVGLGQLVATEGGPWEWLGSVLAAHPSTTQQVRLALRHLGEVAWMGVLFAGAWTVVERRRDRGRGPLIAAVVTLVLLVVGWAALQQVVGHRFRLLLFGAFRFGLCLDDRSAFYLPGFYALPLGAALGGGLFGLADRNPAVRQLGAGLILWLAAGYAPHTPIQLLYLVLACICLTRAAQALDPEGEWRERQPWARFTG